MMFPIKDRKVAGCFYVVTRCDKHDRTMPCPLPEGHGDICSTFLSSQATWCLAAHPAGVLCNREKGHAGLHLHTETSLCAVYEEWVGASTEEQQVWRARAVLMGLETHCIYFPTQDRLRRKREQVWAYLLILVFMNIIIPILGLYKWYQE